MASDLPPVSTPVQPETPEMEPTEPQPDRLHRLKVLALALLVPAALLLGLSSFQEYRVFQQATEHLLQADALAEQEKPREALIELEKCVAAYPGYYEAYNLMASLHYHEQNYEAAVHAYKRGLEALPDHGLLHLNTAEMLIYAKRPAEALPLAERAAQLLPGDPRPSQLIQRCRTEMAQDAAS
jgi:tetratricopeptide (TPR) repeat protein